MLSMQAQAKLRDPSYFTLHLQAAAAIREVGQLRWYDSHFLRRVEIAKRYLAKVRPDALATFLDGFSPLKPSQSFRETLIDDVFDRATCDTIIEISRAAKPDPSRRQAKENADFGRDVLWNIPYFLDLQEQVRGRIAQIVGQPLVSSYNFLSLYGASGKCGLHMDHPLAMYTFDYCIEQDAVWPIHISRTIEWATQEETAVFNPDRIIADPQMGFAEHLLRPNQALLFNGSSQWHYRNPKTAGGFCNLLFFHYYPEGCDDLVDPRRWAEHFPIDELEPLCDLFNDPRDDGLGDASPNR